MAADRQYLTETIANVKKVLAAQSDGSESDDSIAYTSNRGRKLKRKARFVHEGALNDAKGPRVYKKEIEFYGKRRKIIYQKEPLRKRNDDSESDAEEDSDDDTTSVSDDLDPYSEIRIDKILAPCENAADLPSHPSMSHIYTSRTLNDLLQQSLTKLCEEQAHTTKLKNLLTVFLGDDPFVNLEKMQWPDEDFAAIARERSDNLLRELGGPLLSARGSISNPTTTALPSVPAPLPSVLAAPAPATSATATSPLKPTTNGDFPTALPKDPIPSATTTITTTTITTITTGSPASSENPPPLTATTTAEDMDLDPPLAAPLKTEPTTPPTPPPRRMTTRSTQNSHPTSPPPISPHRLQEIDPWFFPPTFRVDPDFGLPAPEAAETRHLLSSAVQHQDEFLRGLNKVRDGLLRAERFRKYGVPRCGGGGGGGIEEGGVDAEVEAGATLSDGEDYYDPVVWGLEEPLEKGKEEEEENGGEVVNAGKKTRGRRTVGN
ncbi:RXT2-like protein [Tuber borchii]|uniref:RXT2-like protein n=1 Tax=Tuber borchii TaxID=42251 RepID=A0A2T7A3T9_TUBBO|nr:RXT2-like protein [Tuber borchii]